MTNSKTKADDAPAAALEYDHPLEKWLEHDLLRLVLRWLTADRPGTASPHLERALRSYGDAKASLHERLVYWPIHKAIDAMRGSMSREELHEKVGGHPPTLRGIIATARSVGRYGLTIPQRWISPLFVVWNFTNRCNLQCRHCYQNSGPGAGSGELSLREKLGLVDQFAREYVAMVAFAGGEPTLSSDLEPVLERCQKYGMHTTIATHGMLMSPERCERLAGLGLRYVEVSLDSVHAERHDGFRGVPGAWEKSVQGIKNVIATEGMRAGIAMCVHRGNLDEVDDMIRFAVEMGVSCFAHFNFIPVGRGKEMLHEDLTPREREELLELLHGWMESREIGVISTAPQFGRVCLSHAGDDGLISCSHAGNAAGTKARVVAKYLGGCGAGRTYACLQPNGDVTPCVYMPDRVMGNVRKRRFVDVFQQNEWWDLLCDRDERQGGCGTCDYRNYCGGCRARADAYLDRLDHCDPGCIRNEQLWEQLSQGAGAHSSGVRGSDAQEGDDGAFE